MSQPSQPPSEDRQSIWSVVRSVAASMFGVQSAANREKDFAKGRIGAYIVVGLVFTLLFILGVWSLVQLAVNTA